MALIGQQNKFALVLVIIVAFVLCASCENQRKYRGMKKLYGTKIEIPEGLVIRNVKGDTLLYDTTREYASIIIWYDSTSCASCNLHMIERWNRFFQYVEDSTVGVKPMIVFSPGKNELYKFESNLKVTEFKRPMYIDYNNDFGKQNPLINKFKSRSIFLTDREHNIILIGDPYYNNQMLKLYKETIHTLISNNGKIPE